MPKEPTPQSAELQDDVSSDSPQYAMRRKEQIYGADSLYPERRQFDTGKNVTTAWLLVTQCIGLVMLWHWADYFFFVAMGASGGSWGVLWPVFVTYPVWLLVLSALSWRLRTRRRFISAAFFSAFPAAFALAFGIWWGWYA